MLAVVSQFCVLDVSIHAPTRGATISLSRYLDIAGFQSTHPHGVRLTDALCVAAMILFQSTHPHGVRHCIMPTEIDVYIVSIHAPTRGATTIKIIAMTANMFQSTHPHGVRRYTRYKRDKRKVFQSTHPHGVRRPISLPDSLQPVSFNPRTHTGCDFNAEMTSLCLSEFQSTHPHGVRRLRFGRLRPNERGFNPRTHTGCDRPWRCSLRSARVSIHAPTRGATTKV